MGWLDVFTVAIILVVVAVNVYFLVWMAALPGVVARARGHRQADAINVLGWLSLITLFATWVPALVWAYTRPLGVTAEPSAGPGAASPPQPV